MKLQKNNKYKNSLIASVVAFNAVLTACGVTPKNTDIKPVETKIETVEVTPKPTPIEEFRTPKPTSSAEPAIEEPLTMEEEIERLGMISEEEIYSASEIFVVRFKKDNLDKMMLCKVISDDDTIYIHDAFTEVELFTYEKDMQGQDLFYYALFRENINTITCIPYFEDAKDIEIIATIDILNYLLEIEDEERLNYGMAFHGMEKRESGGVSHNVIHPLYEWAEFYITCLPREMRVEESDFAAEIEKTR